MTSARRVFALEPPEQIISSSLQTGRTDTTNQSQSGQRRRWRQEPSLLGLDYRSGWERWLKPTTQYEETDAKDQAEPPEHSAETCSHNVSLAPALPATHWPTRRAKANCASRTLLVVHASRTNKRISANGRNRIDQGADEQMTAPRVRAHYSSPEPNTLPVFGFTRCA